MKNKFSSLIGISLFLIFPKAYSQTLLTINDELANELISKRSIFPVNQINVEYYPLVTGKVESRQYANILQRKKAYEENYLSYVKSKNENEKSYNNKNQIVQLISSYLEQSKDETILDKANKLAKDINLSFVIDDNSSLYAGWGVKPKKQLYIINDKGKYASKSMLKEYMTEITKSLKFRKEIQPSTSVNKYLAVLEEEKALNDADKMVDGLVKSSNKQTRTAYVINDEVPEKLSILGNYKEVSIRKLKATSAIENKFVRNEILDDNITGSSIDTETVVLIENTENHQLYAMQPNIYSSLQSNLLQDKFRDQLIKLGYKPYLNGPLLMVDTKYYNVEATKLLYNKLLTDKSYLAKLDEHYLKVQTLRKQANAYNPSFEKYIRLYRIQKKNMSKIDINAWLNLTKNAIKLENQLFNLENNTFEVAHSPKSESYYKNGELFTDYVISSRNVLGL